MSYDPATVRAVCDALRGDAAARPPSHWRDAQQWAADFIEREFLAEAPAPEPSTDWTCPACGVLGDRQSCRNCGAECRPAEPPTDTLREALERIAAIADPYPARIAREALAATPAREDEGR